MNNIYKVIFNSVLGVMQVVSELAKGNGKTKTKTSHKAKVALVSFASVFSSFSALAELSAEDRQEVEALIANAFNTASNAGQLWVKPALTSSGNLSTYQATMVDNAQKATAIGYKANVGNNQVKNGTAGNNNPGENNTAVGAYASTTNTGDQAFGAYAIANGMYKVKKPKSIAISTNRSSGYEQIIRLDSGSDRTWSFNNVSNDLSTNRGGDNVAVGFKAASLGLQATSLGVKVLASGNNVVAVGAKNSAVGDYSTAIGSDSLVSGNSSFSGGRRNNVSGDRSVGIGYEVNVSATETFAIGRTITANIDNSVYLGKGTTGEATSNRVTKGTTAYANQELNGFTFNFNGGSGTPQGIVTVGNNSSGRRIQHVAAGLVDAASMDAVNGSQLYRTNLGFSNLANTLVTNLGGNAAVEKAGDTLGNLSFSNIGDIDGADTVHGAIKTIADSTITLTGNSGSTEGKNRKSNTSFTIKGETGSGITTTASGSEVSIALDQTTKDTLAKVNPLETKVNTIEGDVSTLKTDVNNNIAAAKTSAVAEANQYTDTQINGLSSTLRFAGDNTTDTPSINLKNDTFKIKGKENFITTSASGTELTIDLAEEVKTKLNNLSSNTTEEINNLTTKLGDTNFTTVNGNTDAPTTITQALTQVTQAVNSGWEIQGQGTKKGEIGAGKKVNFADGNLTTASVEMPENSDTATVKFNVQTAELQNDTSTGQVSVKPNQDGTTQEGNKLVTAGNVAQAINTATSSLSSVLAFRGDNNKTTEATAEGDQNTKVNLKTETLKVLGTDGQITTTASSDGLKIGLAQNITEQLTALQDTAGDVTNLQNLVGNTTPSTAINGNTNAPTNLSEAVSQLTTAVNSGWVLKGNGTKVNDIGATEAVDFVDGTNTTATVTAKNGTKAATVSFSVKTVDLTNDEKTGKITAPAEADKNSLVTAGNLATAVNNAVNPEKLASNIKLSYTSTNGSTTASPAKQVSLSTGLNFKSPDNNLTITANDNGEVVFTAKDWTSDITTAKEGAISASKSYTNSQLSSLSSTLKFMGDTTSTDEPQVNLKDQKLSILGTSGYVTTKAEGQKLTIDLEESLKEKLDNLPDNVTQSLATINNQIGSEPTGEATGLSGKDGLDGKTLTEKVNALRDGTAGNVVYTDPQGNRLVKGADGKYYPAEQVANKVQNPADGKWYPEGTTFKDGQPEAKDGITPTALTGNDVPTEATEIVATTVNPDGSTTAPLQMGNVKSGLGLDGKGADGTSGSPSDPKAITVEKAKEALNGKDGKAGLLAMEGAANLNKVATVGDLQALAQAGIDFLGNEGEAIHKTLGSTLNIQGNKNATYEASQYSADNLITRNDDGILRIEMLKTPTFDAVKLASSNGTPISLTPSEDGSSLTFAKNGTDGETSPVELKGVAAGTTDDSAINKAQLDEVKNQLGLSDTPEHSAQNSPAGQDGLDGKTLTEKVNALRDGTAGNVVYTDPQGNRLVKGADGKYYPAEQVADKVQGADGKWYPAGTTFKDGQPVAKDGSTATALAESDVPTEATEIVATTVNPDGSTTAPLQMGNVKSGLGLDGSGEDGSGTVANPKAVTAQQAKDALNGKNGKAGLLAMEGAANLNKVATVGDLQALAQAGIDFLGNEDESKAIHKTLGSTLNIQGKSGVTYSDDNKANYSADNLITHNDDGTLRIEMLKTPTFDAVKLASSNGTPISLTPSEDGSSLTFAKNGTDGETSPVELKGVAAGNDPTSAINKAQLDEVKNQLGLSDTPEVSPTDSPAGKDGLDGKSLTEKANALRDGLAGNIVYTDPQGNRLVKGTDGKYYPAEQVADKVQGADGNWYPAGTTFKDGQPVDKSGSPATALADSAAPQEVTKDSIVSTMVNPDGSTATPTEMGNVKSSLGLNGSGSQYDENGKLTEKAAKDAVGEAGLLAKSGTELNKVATVGDLQALAVAGLDFAGDSGETVSRKLGEKVTIKGGITDSTKLTENNIGVVTEPESGSLIVKLAKEIQEITSIATETVDGEKTTFNASGLAITGSGDKAGQTASYGLGATTLTNNDSKSELTPESLKLSNADGSGATSELTKDSLSFTKDDGTEGVTVNGKDGTISNLADRTLVGEDGNGLSSDYGTGSNRNNAATEGALKDLADKLGASTPNTLPIDSDTGLSGKDGLNGTSIMDKIQALRDGTAGNMVYTDSDGNRLVKAADGNYYPKDTALDKNGLPPEGTKPVDKSTIVATTVNPDGTTATPVQMGNVKSGLGLDGSAGNDGQDANSANPQALTADAAKKAIAGEDGQSGLLTKSGAELNKVATVGDLQALAQAGIDFTGNNEENVHRPLGTQLQVVGDGVDKAASENFESAEGNINVKSDAAANKLTVQLSKDLSNLNSAEFKDAEGNTTKIDSAGITITPVSKEGDTATPAVSLTSAGLNNGGNKISGLATGTDDTDAVTVAQLKELTKAVTGNDNIDVENKSVEKNTALNDGTFIEGDTEGEVFVQNGKPLLKTYNVSDQKEQVTNSVYTAISNMNEQGIKFFHTNDGETTQKNEASNTEDSSASGKYATAVGYNASADGENSLAVGSGSTVHGDDSISVGTGNEVFGNNSGVFGDPSIINAKSSYLVGNDSTIGAGDELTDLINQRDALTRPERPAKLAAKSTSESDADYQNRVNQYVLAMADYNTAFADYMEKRDEINQKIIALSEQTQNVMAMGNNIEVTQGSHGALVIGSNSYVNVVNSGLDSNIHGIAIGNNTRVDTNASSVALGSNAYAVQSLEALQSARVYAHEQAVGKGSEVIGEVSFGQEGKYRRLTNVAAGAADTDAVNVSQLKSVTSNIQQSLNNLSQDLNGVSASAAAMANLPQAYAPGDSIVAISTGYHRGQSAIAFGVSRIADNGKLIIKASASHNTRNDFTGGVGIGYKW